MTDFTAPPTFAPAAPKTAPAAPAVPPVAPAAAPKTAAPAAPTAAPAAPTAAPAAPAAPTAAPAAPTAAPAAPVAEVAPAEKKKQVRLATKIIGNDEITFVVQNVAKMGYNEMAEKIGITKHQVNRILQTLKEGLRKSAVDAAEVAGEKAYGDKTTKKGEIKADYAAPLSALAQKVENKITANLSRPADTRPGAKGGGKAKQALDSTLDAMLADL